MKCGDLQQPVGVRGERLGVLAGRLVERGALAAQAVAQLLLGARRLLVVRARVLLAHACRLDVLVVALTGDPLRRRLDDPLPGLRADLHRPQLHEVFERGVAGAHLGDERGVLLLHVLDDAS